MASACSTTAALHSGRLLSPLEFAHVDEKVRQVHELAVGKNRRDFLYLLGEELKSYPPFHYEFGKMIEASDGDVVGAAEKVYIAYKDMLRVLRGLACTTEMKSHKFALQKQDFNQTKGLSFQTFKKLVELTRGAYL